ncbi:MAG TPA: hypothetical protein VFT05_00440 [Burkholderiaceae bacterium]|nr:hypothetical protein [Burkholderiaceae bacterium]
MDQHKLRSLVFDKTGVRIDIDDPIFALVALNEAVLAETVERHVALIEAAAQELARQARLAGGLPPAALASSAAASAAASAAHAAPAGVPQDATDNNADNVPIICRSAGTVAAKAHGAAAPVVAGFAPREWRLLGAAAAVSVLSALLVLGGQAVFFKPAPPPVPVLQAKSLTAEQLLAIQNGEKLAKAVQKLDPKSRSLVQAEMQK